VVRVWDHTLGSERVPLRPGPGEPPLLQCLALALSPDGKVIATSECRYEGGVNHDPALRLWETVTGRPVRRWPLRWGCDLLAFSPDGRLLASAHGDYRKHLPRVCVWDVATGKELACFSGHTSWVTALAFAPDGKTLASASRDTTALIWDVAGLARGR
jgi:WD40 repeat protein